MVFVSELYQKQYNSLKLITDLSYLIIAVDAIKTIEVGLVAILVPPASHVGLGTMQTERIRVFVPA